jgi:hypothetical protein
MHEVEINCHYNKVSLSRSCIKRSLVISRMQSTDKKNILEKYNMKFSWMAPFSENCNEISGSIKATNVLTIWITTHFLPLLNACIYISSFHSVTCGSNRAVRLLCLQSVFLFWLFCCASPWDCKCRFYIRVLRENYKILLLVVCGEDLNVTAIF